VSARGAHVLSVLLSTSAALRLQRWFVDGCAGCQKMTESAPGRQTPDSV
jgi:hypothetical protein